MHVYPDSVPAFHLAALARHLCEQSPHHEAILLKHHLSLASLSLPAARLPRSVMASVLMDWMSSTQRDDLGFEMGWHSDLLQHPLMGKLLSRAQNLGEGLQRMCHYMPLLTPSFKMDCHLDDDGLCVRWRPLRPMPYQMLVLALETILVSAHRTCRQLFPARATPMNARVCWAAPAHAQRYQTLTGLHTEFNTDLGDIGMDLCLPPQVHHMPLPHADADIWTRTHDACRQQLAVLETMQGWKGWISHLLHTVEDHQPTQSEIAGLMGVSLRTLARQLERESTRFRELSLQIRHQRACQLLSEMTLSISEIARILGYTDSANFTRAFRSASGRSPQSYRTA